MQQPLPASGQYPTQRGIRRHRLQQFELIVAGTDQDPADLLLGQLEWRIRL
jgi:hypothetical protein